MGRRRLIPTDVYDEEEKRALEKKPRTLLNLIQISSTLYRKHTHTHLPFFYVPIHVGVATALALQRIIDLCPSMRGDVSVGEQLAMRSAFYRRLARNKKQVRVFGQRAAVLNREAVLGEQGGAGGASV